MCFDQPVMAVAPSAGRLLFEEPSVIFSERISPQSGPPRRHAAESTPANAGSAQMRCSTALVRFVSALRARCPQNAYDENGDKASNYQHSQGRSPVAN